MVVQCIKFTQCGQFGGHCSNTQRRLNMCTDQKMFATTHSIGWYQLLYDKSDTQFAVLM